MQLNETCEECFAALTSPRKGRFDKKKIKKKKKKKKLNHFLSSLDSLILMRKVSNLFYGVGIGHLVVLWDDLLYIFFLEIKAMHFFK